MIFDLAWHIRKFLETVLAETRLLESRTGQPVAPRIFLGDTPPKNQAEDDFPFVIVRPIEGVDAEEGSTVTVALVCGVYTAEGFEGGVNDLLNLVSRIRLALLKEPVLAGRYTPARPLEWELAPDPRRESGSTHPYHLALMTTTWSVPAVPVELTLKEEIEVYGSGLPDDQSV